MSLETIRSALLWCSIMNYGILLLWVALYLLCRGWMQGWLTRWYRLPPNQFDTFNLAGIMGYKLAIIVFNIVPCVSLHLVQ